VTDTATETVDEDELTRRMGYWVDMSTAYWTMDPAYIESVWWSLKQIFDKGLLVEDHRRAQAHLPAGFLRAGRDYQQLRCFPRTIVLPSPQVGEHLFAEATLRVPEENYDLLTLEVS
jgi:hypothetical protein